MQMKSICSSSHLWYVRMSYLTVDQGNIRECGDISQMVQSLIPQVISTSNSCHLAQ